MKEKNITLRQWYIGQALAGYLASFPDHTPEAEGVAKRCIEYADAVIAAEKKKEVRKSSAHYHGVNF